MFLTRLIIVCGVVGISIAIPGVFPMVFIVVIIHSMCFLTIQSCERFVEAFPVQRQQGNPRAKAVMIFVFQTQKGRIALSG